METNAIMKVNFGSSKLTIGHKDKMGNLNELVAIGNEYRAENGREPMRMHKIMENKGIKEYIFMLEKKHNLKSPKKGDLEIVDYKGVKNILKTRRGKNGGTWTHLNVMVRVAIEMNPEFADEVITKFVKGKLLDYRDITGNDFKILSKSIGVFSPTVKQRIHMAKGLNWIVFNTHYREARNEASVEQLAELTDIQKKLAFAVDMGYIKSFDELIAQMQIMYRIKWSSIGG